MGTHELNSHCYECEDFGYEEVYCAICYREVDEQRERLTESIDELNALFSSLVDKKVQLRINKSSDPEWNFTISFKADESESCFSCLEPLDGIRSCIEYVSGDRDE